MNADHKSAACPFCGEHLSGKQKTGFYVHPNNDCLLSRFEFDDLAMAQWERRVSPYAVRIGASEPTIIESRGHDSDCAVYNEPAYPNGPCNCSLSNLRESGAAPCLPNEREGK